MRRWRAELVVKLVQVLDGTSPPPDASRGRAKSRAPDFSSRPLRCHIYSCRNLASKGFPSGYSKRLCVRLHSESSEPTMVLSQTTLDEHSPTPPPCRWLALFTLPTLAKFQLVWRRICDVVLFPSCLVEHTLTAVCVLPEYRSGRKYNIHLGIFVSI